MVMLTREERMELKEIARQEREKFQKEQHTKAFQSQVEMVRARHGRSALSGLIDIGEAKAKEFMVKKGVEVKARMQQRFAAERVAEMAANTPQRAAMQEAEKRTARDKAYNMLMGVSQGQVPVTRRKGGKRMMMNEQDVRDKAFKDMIR